MGKKLGGDGWDTAIASSTKSSFQTGIVRRVVFEMANGDSEWPITLQMTGQNANLADNSSISCGSTSVRT